MFTSGRQASFSGPLSPRSPRRRSNRLTYTFSCLAAVLVFVTLYRLRSWGLHFDTIEEKSDKVAYLNLEEEQPVWDHRRLPRATKDFELWQTYRNIKDLPKPALEAHGTWLSMNRGVSTT